MVWSYNMRFGGEQWPLEKTLGLGLGRMTDDVRGGVVITMRGLRITSLIVGVGFQVLCLMLMQR